MGQSEAAIAGAMAATDRFLERFNAADAAGHVSTLAFPHVRLASGRVRIWEGPDEAVAALELAFPALQAVGWDHSTWERREVVHAGSEKVHLDVEFTRWRTDGSVLGVYPAVYVIVQADGHWRIQCRSSFAP